MKIKNIKIQLDSNQLRQLINNRTINITHHNAPAPIEISLTGTDLRQIVEIVKQAIQLNKAN